MAQLVFIIQVGKKLTCRGPVTGTLEEINRMKEVIKRYYTMLYGVDKIKISISYLQPYGDLE